MQKTKVTGKAATLLVRSMKPYSPSLSPTIKRLVIFLLLIIVILSSGFFKFFGIDENHAEMLFSSLDFFLKGIDLHSAFMSLDITASFANYKNIYMF